MPTGRAGTARDRRANAGFFAVIRAADRQMTAVTGRGRRRLDAIVTWQAIRVS